MIGKLQPIRVDGLKSMEDQLGFHLVGFDLDGTLVDTSVTLMMAANQARAEWGYPPVSHEEIRKVVSQGAAAMVSRDLPIEAKSSSTEISRLKNAMLRCYEARIADGSVTMPGVMAAIDELNSLGIPVAVATNKSEKYAHQLLSELGIAHRFSAILGTGSSKPYEPKPAAGILHAMVAESGIQYDSASAKYVAYVGDSGVDMIAAQAAGMVGVFYRHGFEGGHSEEATVSIEHFSELLPALRKLG